MRLSVCIAAAAFLVATAAASADEGPTLLTGDYASMVGTRVACLAAASAVRCGRTGGLSVVLSRSGTVTVTHGGAPMTPVRGHRKLRLGPNGGFFVATTPIYCHVYVANARVMTCSVGTAKGGIPNSRGFDISDHTVFIFRYGSQDDRHLVKTYRMR
jgi:hypothetical protein